MGVVGADESSHFRLDLGDHRFWGGEQIPRDSKGGKVKTNGTPQFFHGRLVEGSSIWVWLYVIILLYPNYFPLSDKCNIGYMQENLIRQVTCL